MKKRKGYRIITNPKVELRFRLAFLEQKIKNLEERLDAIEQQDEEPFDEEFYEYLKEANKFLEETCKEFPRTSFFGEKKKNPEGFTGLKPR